MNNINEFNKKWEANQEYYGTCELCSTENISVAPFGPEGKWICVGCGTKEIVSTLTNVVRYDREKNQNNSNTVSFLDISTHDLSELLIRTTKDSECEICGNKRILYPAGTAGSHICIECCQRPENRELAKARLEKTKLWALHETQTKKVRAIEQKMELERKRTEANGRV